MNRDSRLRAATIAAAVLVLLTLGVPGASADIFSYSMDQGNGAVASGGSGPYATVTVNRTSNTTATITFEALINGGFQYLMGDGSTAAVNVNGGFVMPMAATYENLSDPSWADPSFVSAGAKNVSDFGDFNLSIKSFDGYTHAATKITFTVTGGNWGSAASVLTPNADGYSVATHIYACAEPCTSAASGAAFTGFAADGNVPVPEPGVLLISGVFAAVLGLVGLKRRYA